MKLDTKSYKGTRDIYPDDMRLRQYIFDTWSQVCESFGYEKYDAPIIEPVEIYAAKSGEELVSEQTYAFVDRGDRKVAIRPEMTPSISRMVAAKRQELPYPARLYSIANFMRYERPQSGREREFWQLNFDLFGSDDINADIEIIRISDEVLRQFGAKPEMYTILVNDRRLTNYVMRDYLGLDEAKAGAMVKLFDRKNKMSAEDFNKQAIEIAGRDEILAKIEDLIKAEKIEDLPAVITDNGPVTEVKQLLISLGKCGIVNARYDATLMRGLDYYTGIVFEVYDNSPENNRSMFGGGRYDGLVGLFGVEDLPVVGVAQGETTTMNFLRAWNLIPKLKPATDIYLIPLGVDASEIVNSLRNVGVNVAVELGERKVERAIKTADKLGIPYVLFVGENELSSGKFNLKNLQNGEEQALDLGEIIDLITNEKF